MAAPAAPAEQTEEPKKSGNGLMIVLIVLVVILILAVGGLAAYMLLGQKHDGKGDAAGSDAHQTSEAYQPETHEVQYSPKYKQFKAPLPDSPPLFFDLEQMVVNFKGEGKARHLAVKIKMMTHYPEVVTSLESIKPLLINDFSDMLRRKTYTEMSVDDAQTKLAEEMLAIARKNLETEKVYPDLLEKVLVERFVMQ